MSKMKNKTKKFQKKKTNTPKNSKRLQFISCQAEFPHKVDVDFKKKKEVVCVSFTAG